MVLYCLLPVTLLHDSYTTASNGCISPNGISILLKFKSLRDVHSYVIQTYLTDQGLPLQHELQFVKVQIEHISVSLIKSGASKEYSNKISGKQQQRNKKAT